MDDRFQLGDRVTWTSRDGGVAVKMEGEICEVVAKDQCPRSLEGIGTRRRKHESYVVAVYIHPLRSTHFYFPLVSQLRKVNPGSTTSRNAPQEPGPESPPSATVPSAGAPGSEVERLRYSTTQQEGTEAVFMACLQVAVPMWIDRFRNFSRAELAMGAEALGDFIAHNGDRFMRTTKPGRPAEAFNKVAEAIARTVLLRGWVDVFGVRFEAQRAPKAMPRAARGEGKGEG